MAHCRNFQPQPVSRRDMLRQSAMGFGSLALTHLLTKDGKAVEEGRRDSKKPFLPREPHFPAKAKHVIYLYLDGGPSQVDTWDPKPRLAKENGQPFGMNIEPTQFNNIGKTLASPWKFDNYGESGIPCSDLFKNIAQHVDKMAFVRSMTSNFSEHTNANYFLHTGIGVQGRPSMGAWVGYGLGSECENLPAYVVLNGGLTPPGGLDNFGSGFLPASYQGSVFGASNQPVAYVNRKEASDTLQRNKLALLQKLDRREADRVHQDDQIESAIANYELAYRMQDFVPRITNFDNETEETLKLYGMDLTTKGTATYARQLLLARRLVQEGVRFIEVTCPSVGHDRWDQHGNLLNGHQQNADCVDIPIAGLITDLDRLGLLKETLIVCSGEFGRTPFAQGSNGRDHNPFGFTIWMCGGGAKGGTIFGATDEYGYKAVENKVMIHDLHATMLAMLGMDHEQLTFRFSGRDMRLTDVHGEIIHDIIA